MRLCVCGRVSACVSVHVCVCACCVQDFAVVGCMDQTLSVYLLSDVNVCGTVRRKQAV